jgi:L-malate glycosyltransferase
LMLNFEFPPIGGGGANACRQLLLQYSGRSDISLDVLTSAPNPGLVKEQLAGNVTIYKVGIHKKSLQFWRKIEVIEWLIKAGTYYRKLLRDNKYDLAHAFFGFPTGWVCYRSAGRLPYLISLRGSDVPGGHARLQLDYKILGPVFKAIWKKAFILITPSIALKRRALDFMPNVNIEVIPNGVDLERFRPAQISNRPSQLRLVTVGRLSVTKRIDLLIDTVEILVKDGYQVLLTVIGSGSEQNRLEQLISQKKVGHCVKMKGFVEPKDMPDIYRSSDLYISGSMQEGMSNAMLEAMASGLPIITTACEGLDELIEDNGIILEQADAKRMAAEIKKFADNRGMIEKTSLAARKKAESFRWSCVADRYIEYYQKMLRKKK